MCEECLQAAHTPGAQKAMTKKEWTYVRDAEDGPTVTNIVDGWIDTYRSTGHATIIDWNQIMRVVYGPS